MPVRVRIHRHGLNLHAAQSTEDAAANRAAVGDQNSHAAAQISTCTGVGLYALHGLFNCGQLLISASTSVSARISTYLPGSEMPSSNVSLPSVVTGTFIKKLMLLVMSRFDIP